MKRLTLGLWSTTALIGLVASPAMAKSHQPATAQTQPAPAPNAASAEPTVAPETNAATNNAAADQAIVVTGIRRSLQSAQNIRRNSEQIVDSVVAEDIGKLPDLNTAETAARIPGVQVYRQGGEAQNVLVRGLPFYTTTYNGREIFTAETRVVALQDFPSSNIAALEVYKTSTADLVEPGLAGLVNVRSRQPFDFKSGEVAGSIWGLYTRQGHKALPNFNLLATDRWSVGDGGEFGLLVNGSYEQMRYLDGEISNTDFIADPTVNGSVIRLPDIQRLFYRSGHRGRPSVNVSAQYRPDPDTTFYLEGLWQGFRNQIDDRLLEVPLYGGNSYSNLTFRNNSNVVSSGTVVEPGGRIFSFQGATYNKTDTFQFAGGAKLNRGPWKLNVDLARSMSTFIGSTESLDRRFTSGYTSNFNLEQPSFGLSGINLTSPSSQIFQGLFEENQRSAGRDWQARGDVQYDINNGLLKNIQFGVRWTDHNATREYGSRYANLAPLNIPLTALPVSSITYRGVSDANPTYQWAAPTYDSIRDNVVGIRQLVITNCPAVLILDPKNGCPQYTTGVVPRGLLYTAHEHSLAGYGQLNFGNDVIDGVVGARVLRTRTRVAGAKPSGIAAIDDPRGRTIFLPNASIRARVSPEFQLRAAVSKTQTQPNFSDLNPALVLGAPPSGGVGTPSAPYSASGGNPFLRPYTSWNFDAAAEYYFGRTSFASITAFRRDVKGFIQQQTYDVTDPTLGTIRVSGPVNTGKGRISGVELQAQTFFDIDGLPDWARGFGIQANLTYLNAKTQQYNGTSTNGIQNLSYFPITDQLNGVSKWNYNLVGIYERHGFSARLTYSGRSKFAASRQYRGDDLYLETAHPAGRLDLSLNYEVTPNFTLFGDWTNITRKPFRQDFSSARNGAPRAEYPRYLRYDESTLSLGLRFRFGGDARPVPVAAPMVAPPPPPPAPEPVVEPAPPPPPPPPAPVQRGERG